MPLEYRTKKGRIVYGGGGITPDVTVKQLKLPSYVQGLWREGVFLTFAVNDLELNGLDM